MDQIDKDCLANLRKRARDGEEFTPTVLTLYQDLLARDAREASMFFLRSCFILFYFNLQNCFLSSFFCLNVIFNQVRLRQRLLLVCSFSAH